MAFKEEYTNAYVTPERPYKEDDPWAHGDVNNIIAGIEEAKNEASEAKNAASGAIATANEYTDGKIGDIEAALDELHTYAQSLVGGGV